VTHECAVADVCQLHLSGGRYRPGMEGFAGRMLGLVFLCRGKLGANMADEVTYQDDIVLQLRRAAVWTMMNDQRHMLDQAADEIERLRLTDAEREAVVWFAGYGCDRPLGHATTLRSLLERLK